jgi:hypothetical protein
MSGHRGQVGQLEHLDGWDMGHVSDRKGDLSHDDKG